MKASASRIAWLLLPTTHDHLSHSSCPGGWGEQDAALQEMWAGALSPQAKTKPGLCRTSGEAAAKQGLAWPGPSWVVTSSWAC